MSSVLRVSYLVAKIEESSELRKNIAQFYSRKGRGMWSCLNGVLTHLSSGDLGLPDSRRFKSPHQFTRLL
jgi:hypothetical protein